MVAGCGPPGLERWCAGENWHVTQPGHGEWVRYWRSPDGRVEAMYARFRAHAYRRHGHETYSFGLTEAGAQFFRCRGGGHTSSAGMVMAFNPDDPHDGEAADHDGFTYRMVHVLPETVELILAQSTGRPGRLPLFAQPVIRDDIAAGSLRHLHAALRNGTPLEWDERLASAVLALARSASTAATRVPALDRVPAPAAAQLAGRVRALSASSGSNSTSMCARSAARSTRSTRTSSSPTGAV
ncbi:MAG TPA: AraC family ligand binding domain-containing protein [Candidatus Dormibacteraeota bacterium]|nr:AraC family ligand binding domain-containing protein [Candidatus Dormibacteraeota bacterium]